LALTISTPAKVNLWLEIIRKREDRYHELSSLMVPVAVYDRVEVAWRDEAGVSLSCNSPDVPSDSGNLAWRAADVYCRASGIARGVSIRLEKNIPVGAGMGGGSADAAAVLLGLNRLKENPLSAADLQELAVGLGADVPFFLHCTPALATGIGERLHAVEGIPDYPLVLVKPPISVSTGWVYGSLKLTRGESRIRLRSFLARPWNLSEVLQNDLETVTLNEYPQLVRIKHWLLENGAVVSWMSGSGPTIFGVFKEQRQAESAGDLARRVWKDCWVDVTRVLGTPVFAQA
jgi:4-diphosphocytidyl-2-C-methyl-D-erythritol kinase